MAIIIFVLFVVFVIGLSLYLGNKAKTSSGYYAAGGKIHWGVNGIAFAGDYLSAASFLGIAGLIAVVGYDGFLYSIGYLAGWVVALFVVAEPLKKLGKYTFTDAVDAKYNSRGIKLAAAISTLVVSVCYLIPQMVGAGVLVEPLLGLPHAAGVIMVGAIVITIVATAGMASTTYVQFLKGGLLILLSAILIGAVVMRGLSTQPDQGGSVPFYQYQSLPATRSDDGQIIVGEPGWTVLETQQTKDEHEFVKLGKDGVETWWLLSESDAGLTLMETQSVVAQPDGVWINGAPASETNKLRQVGNLETIRGQSDVNTGPLPSPIEFLSTMTAKDTTVRTFKSASFADAAGAKVTVYYPEIVTGDRIMRPGLKFKIEGTLLERLDFLSLMLALFLGTAALPHILIRYYTVSSPAAARKSTIVAIIAISMFYVLTLFMGLGAMTNAVLNPADSNMAAPLLARSFGEFLFAMISAVAFATVLGTVSGLIVAASGAVAHDLLDRFMQIKMDDRQKVRAGKISAFVIGGIAILLGIIFKGVNVSFLVGLAFAVAASANLPAIVMLLFWKKTTAMGITASIITGIVASLGLIALSPDMFALYGLNPLDAPVPFSNPGIISIPLSFLVLIVVSLLTQKKAVMEIKPVI